jgi:hypothetical protein
MCKGHELMQAQFQQCKWDCSIVLVVHIIVAAVAEVAGGGGYSPYDRRLSHTKTGDESAGVDGAKVALHSASHKNSNANSPDKAQYSRGIQPANTITNQEGTIAKMQEVIR